MVKALAENLCFSSGGYISKVINLLSAFVYNLALQNQKPKPNLVIISDEGMFRILFMSEEYLAIAN